MNNNEQKGEKTIVGNGQNKAEKTQLANNSDASAPKKGTTAVSPVAVAAGVGGAVLASGAAVAAYNVSLLDFDGGDENNTAPAQTLFADGTTVEIEEAGDTLSPLFTSGIAYAAPQDYAQYAEFQPANNDSQIIQTYHIEAGDTLSEIALQHNTTVDRIMELNPQIEDADLIYAGDDLILPGEEDIDLDLPDAESATPAEEVVDLIELEDNSAELESQEFEQVDWASFEGGATTSSDEYNNLLSNTDFDTYDTPDSYPLDMGGGDFL